MKQFILATFSLVVFMASANAQFEDVKKYLLLGQYPMAKQSLDALASKPKANSKPEYFLAKATILSHLMGTAQPPESMKMRDESIEAYRKYLSLDPANSENLQNDNAYRNAPINYYSSYYKEAFDLFNKSDYVNASTGFKNMVEWSDVLIKNKILAGPIDTTAIYLAGASHQNAKKYDEAAAYYGRLADAKVTGEDYSSMYKFLMSYHFEKGNIAEFQKYKQLGQELYPKDEFFGYDEMTFILNMENETEKFRRIEGKIAQEPNNAKLNQIYGSLLFEKLTARDVNIDAPEYKESEKKMIDALTRSAAASPDDPMPNFLIGKEYQFKSERVDEKIDGVIDEIRKFNQAQKPDKNGKTPPPPKELTARRDSLRTIQGQYLDQSAPYLLKAEPLMAKTYKNDKSTRQNYKILVGDLISYYTFKGQYTKNAAEKPKFLAEEKKWTDVYDKIQ